MAPDTLTVPGSRDEMKAEVARLKKERNAVILAHSYQRGDVQDVADYVGDSLGLSMKARETNAPIIVFCGVHFMAETAKILCPDRTVLMPDPNAGCPMANMITEDRLAAFKAEHPGVPVVAYINTSAAVKALCDYVVTSANAVEIVEKIPHDELLFVPDRYLGGWVQRQTKKKLHLWPGYCPTHLRFLPEDLKALREKMPDAEVIMHPEAETELWDLADRVIGTEGMFRYFATQPAGKRFIIGTEDGFLYRARKAYPDKEFHIISQRGTCPNMKKTTLEKVLWALQDLVHEITVPEDIAARSKLAIDRMFELH